MNTKSFRLIAILMLLSSFLFAQQNKNITLASKVQFDGSRLSNIWGYRAPDGKEYALVGLTGFDNNFQRVCDCAVSIVDVTDPAKPVKKFTIDGPNSTWREIRTWQSYAYVTTEAGGGVTIIDLTDLPVSVTATQYTGDGDIENQLNKVHALHIDEKGFMYLYGGNLSGGGAKIFSLSDPLNPKYLGVYDENYVHDGIVRNDTLWAAQIFSFDRSIAIVDVKNKANPKLVSTFETPGRFAHNTWLSSNNKVVYTTDEIDASFVAAFDISNVLDIKELDRYQRLPNDSAVVHNTYVLTEPSITGFATDFVWTSYYSQGVTVLDAGRPDNLVEIGNYDTNPLVGGHTNGAWGVYPYFASGTILVSDMGEGMFVLRPTYRRACYLEGEVTDGSTGSTLSGVDVEIINTNVTDKGKINGTYKVGYQDAGTYDVRFARSGYSTKVISGVELKSGEVTVLDVQLFKPGVGMNNASVSVGLHVYPNPSSGEFVLEYDATKLSGNLQLYVSNLLGQGVRKIPVGNASGKLYFKEKLPRGVYTLNIVDERNSSEKIKLVVH